MMLCTEFMNSDCTDAIWKPASAENTYDEQPSIRNRDDSHENMPTWKDLEQARTLWTTHGLFSTPSGGALHLTSMRRGCSRLPMTNAVGSLGSQCGQNLESQRPVLLLCLMMYLASEGATSPLSAVSASSNTYSLWS